jgi:hypothetical protein
MSSPSAPGDLTLTVNRDVVARQVSDGMVLLDLDSGTYFTLNEVGALIWRKLEAGNDLEAVANAILAEFDVDEATVRGDIAGLVAELRSHGLLLGE